ncbi:MAG: alpha-amylase family glycosyl hydrolase [Bacteroidales bacterium]
MHLRNFLFLIITGFILFTACDKDDTSPPDDPGEPTDTIPEVPDFEVPATGDIIMYEVNLRAFSQGGDLQGVIDRLNHLKDLSVNVIWLMPIHPTGQINSVNSPYSVKNYKEVGAEYGTFDDLVELTDEAHARGMAVIMDWVANHTAWDNPWIYDHPEWYSQDGSGNIIIPPGTNWQDVADLNFDNPQMRLAMIDAMKYWVTQANVDGFRCDYADGVPYDFWQQAIDSLHDIPGREYILLAEGERDDHFDAGFDLTFGWNFYATMKSVFEGQSATALYNTHKNVYEEIPAGHHRLRFTTNHDESAWDATPMVLFDGQQGALAASAVTTFMGGVPLIYTGQEVGRVQALPFFSNDPVNWNNNPAMLQEYEELMAVYASCEPAKYGTATDYSGADVVCFTREHNSDELLLIANMRDENQTRTLPAEISNSTWENALTGEMVSLTQQVELAGYQYLILSRQR